jgi:E3 ubiquitin-protein ligase CCNP1IP1
MTQGIGLVNLQSSRVAGTPMSSRRPSSRGILPGLGGSTGSSSGFSGYGMSAGLKASNPAGPGPGSGPGGYVQPMMGSRGLSPRIDRGDALI